MKASEFLENFFKSLNGKKKLSKDRKSKSLGRLVLSMTSDYFAYTYKNARNANEILPKAINHLADEVSDKTQFLNDKTGLFAFYFVGKMLAYEANSIDEALFENASFLAFLSDMISYLYDERHTVDFGSQLTNIYTPEQVPNLNELKVMLFKYTVFVTNQVLLMSTPACKLYMQTKSGLSAHLGFMNDEFFVLANADRHLIMWDQKENALVEFLLSNLSTLAKNSEEQARLWTEQKACDTLTKLVRFKPSLAFSAYNTAANVASDNELETLPQLETFASMLVDLLRKFGEALMSDSVKRTTRRVDQSNMVLTAEVIVIDLEDTSVTNSLASVMRGLYKLALNRKFRYELFFNLNARQYLKDVLLRGNSFEVNLAARVLAQMSFERDVALDLDEDSQYGEFIDKTLQRETIK
jgi:hypothetical protein